MRYSRIKYSEKTMFPSKSMFDYMTEMNRVFPKTSENDMLHSSNYGIYSQSPSQTTFFNRSSSSADSLSPESYPDVFMPRTSEAFNIRCETQNHNFAVPRKQRAIVGRKILGNAHYTQHTNNTGDNEINFTNAWADELSVTPPTIEKYQTRNYELFPSDMQSPNKNLTSLSPINSMSPPFSVEMPRMSSPQPMQRFSQKFAPNKISGFSPPFLGESSSKSDEIASSKMCTFCRKNGEAPLVFMTHAVKEKIGNQNVVTCPILRSHVCSTCGASGDNAHTITYCPVLRSTNNGKRLQSTTITLKNTRIKSNGRRRY